MKSVIFEITDSFCGAFLHIILTWSVKDWSESISVPKSFMMCYSHIIESPTFETLPHICVRIQEDDTFYIQSHKIILKPFN